MLTCQNAWAPTLGVHSEGCETCGRRKLVGGGGSLGVIPEVSEPGLASCHSLLRGDRYNVDQS